MENEPVSSKVGGSQRDIKWLSTTGVTLTLLGMGVSVWLTIAHYTTKVVLACPDTGLINCAKVTSSVYSMVFGVPLVLLGLCFFIGMLFLQLPVAWRSQNPLIRRGRLVVAASGLVMVFWLVYVELFRLNAICLYCTSVHIVTILLFMLTALGTALTSEV